MSEAQTITTFTATSLPGFPARATREEAEADEARGLEVRAFTNLLPTLTEAQWDKAWDVTTLSATWNAAWDTWNAAWDTARGAERGAAWRAARVAGWGVAWRPARIAEWGAARGAVIALLVRDLITADQFATLTAPMRAAGIDFDKLGEDK